MRPGVSHCGSDGRNLRFVSNGRRYELGLHKMKNIAATFSPSARLCVSCILIRMRIAARQARQLSYSAGNRENRALIFFYALGPCHAIGYSGDRPLV